MAIRDEDFGLELTLAEGGDGCRWLFRTANIHRSGHLSVVTM